MKVVVAMATYNGSRFLLAQLESIARQTRLPDELVITDDCSDDETSSIVEEFSKSAPFCVRFIRNPARLGPTANFNHALSLSTGDLVLLSDQDDVWLPEKISSLVAIAEDNPRKSCFINDAYMADGDLRPTGTTKMQQIELAGLPREAMVMGCCTAIRRELLEVLLPIPATQRAHDNWLVQMSDLLDLTIRLPVPLQYYRRHGHNVSDYFVNRLDPPGFAERLLSAISSALRRATNGAGLIGELIDLEDALARMDLRHEALAALVGRASLARTQHRVGERARRLAARREIRSLDRSRRVGPTLRLWREGGYRHGGGWTSALKDLSVRREQGIGPSR